MTVALNLEAVITSISNVSVTGLTICDLNEIPNAPDSRLAYLIPSPAEPSFLTNFELIDVTTGHNLAAKDATYTLNYKLLYKRVGVGRGLADILPGLYALAVDFVDVMEGTALLSGAVTWDVAIGDLAVIVDPSGIEWHGCAITVMIHEFVQ